MKGYAIYDKSTGRIRRVMSDNLESAKLQCQSGDLGYARCNMGDGGATHYVGPDTGRKRKRPATECHVDRSDVSADGITPVTLSGMADDTHIRVDGLISGEMTTSGTDTLTFTNPGRYTVTATAPFPAKSKTLTVLAL